MKLIYICSPYRGDVEKHVRIARKMVRLALKKGFTPIAPHLMYPQALPDDVPENRAIGLRAGLSWVSVCDELWIWGDIQMSEGMWGEVLEARRLGLPTRTITPYEVEEVVEE